MLANACAIIPRMLRVDRIDLAILKPILDSHDSRGPTMRLIEWTTAIVMHGQARPSEQEVLNELLSLHQDQYVEFGTYIGQDFIRYRGTEGPDYFRSQAFRCTPLPKARRRMQQLSSGDRHGIFISHISAERPIAIRLQELLGATLSADLPVSFAQIAKAYRVDSRGMKLSLRAFESLRLSSPSSRAHPWIGDGSILNLALDWGKDREYCLSSVEGWSMGRSDCRSTTSTPEICTVRTNFRQ